jgi:hypothetical protein
MNMNINMYNYVTCACSCTSTFTSWIRTWTWTCTSKRTWLFSWTCTCTSTSIWNKCEHEQKHGYEHEHVQNTWHFHVCLQVHTWTCPLAPIGMYKDLGEILTFCFHLETSGRNLNFLVLIRIIWTISERSYFDIKTSGLNLNVFFQCCTSRLNLNVFVSI